MATKTGKRDRRTNFYEAMPGTMDGYRFLPAAGEYLGAEEHRLAAEEQARRRMMRQGMALLGLLALQIVLFVVLVQSTVNLG